MSARVVITGASGGIGGATAAALRERGARVVGLDLVADPAHDVLACDVRDQTSVDAAVAEAIEARRPRRADQQRGHRHPAARTMVRAALGPPARDLATTRFGTRSYAIVRRLPRSLMDSAGRRQLRRLARKGHFAGSPLAAELDARLRT